MFALSSTVAAQTQNPKLAQITKKLQTGQPVKLAAIGDSITYICYHTDFKRNYMTFVADALRRAYPKSNIELEVAGNLGGCCGGMANLDELLLAKQPDLVFVMFGMNDCGGGRGELEAYDDNLTKFIRRIRSTHAMPVILTQNQIVYESEGGQRRRALPEYMKRAVEVSKREGVLCVDLFSDWLQLQESQLSTWTERLDDAYHPNLAGHRLFAAGILKALWPEAAKFHYSGSRPPLAVNTPEWVPCLLPGPSGKQIVRTDPTTFVVLTGGRRCGVNTELVLWISQGKADPTWHDFCPTILVGPGEAPVFAGNDTPINSGMILLGSNGRLFILFSQTVRLNLLAIDTKHPDWVAKLKSRNSYRSIMFPDLPQPISIKGNSKSDIEILDAFNGPDGLPQFILHEMLLNVGRGVTLEQYSSDKKEYLGTLVLPECKLARVAVANSSTAYVIGQRKRGEILQAAKLPDSSLPSIKRSADDFLLFTNDDRPVCVYKTTGDSSGYIAAELTEAGWKSIKVPSRLSEAEAIGAIDGSQGKTVLAYRDGEVARYCLRQNELMPLTTKLSASIRLPWRYEEHLPVDADRYGVVWENQGGLEFSLISMRGDR